MRYEVKVAGKVFAGENVRELLRRAVAAKRQAEARRNRPVSAPSRWSSAGASPSGPPIQ